MRAAGFEPIADSCSYQPLRVALSQIPSQGCRAGFEICEVISAWPSLPEALRVGVLAIVRSHLGDLFTNRGSESASGAKVVAGPAAKRKSSGAGAKPELPVCEQVGRGISRDFVRSDCAGVCSCESGDGICVGRKRGCLLVDDCGRAIVCGQIGGRK